MTTLLLRLWIEDEGQDIAEYAVMLAVILVLVVGTVRLVGSNARLRSEGQLQAVAPHGFLRSFSFLP